MSQYSAFNSNSTPFEFARMNFLEVARKSQARLTQYRHDLYRTTPFKGPHGEDLITDVASIGHPHAPHRVVVLSGVHGPELPIGSDIQCDWIQMARDYCNRRRDTVFHFVHALNPSGAAYSTRGNENNVDPIRGFADFTKPLPSSEAYRPFAEVLQPDSLNWKASAKSLLIAMRHVVLNGPAKSKQGLMDALIQGQYTHADGLFYGGQEPQTFQSVWHHVARHEIGDDQPRTLFNIDLHTGYGTPGQAVLFTHHVTQSKPYAYVEMLAHEGHIPITRPTFLGEGNISDVWNPYARRGTIVTNCVLEIGTKMEALVLYAMVKRNTLWHKHNDRHPHAGRYIQAMQEAFSPSNYEWKRKARQHGHNLWRGLTHCLNSAAPR